MDLSDGAVDPFKDLPRPIEEPLDYDDIISMQMEQYVQIRESLLSGHLHPNQARKRFKMWR